MKSVFLLCLLVLAAIGQQSSVPRPSSVASSSTPDVTARVAVLESKVETLTSEMQKLQQKIDSLMTQVQDLNTKMNLVLVVGSIIFGAMITQMAGALSGRKSLAAID